MTSTHRTVTSTTNYSDCSSQLPSVSHWLSCSLVCAYAPSHSQTRTHGPLHLPSVSRTVPLYSLLARPGQTDAIFSTRGKSVPCSCLAPLNRAPHHCCHSRGHTLGPWIRRLHPSGRAAVYHVGWACKEARIRARFSLRLFSDHRKASFTVKSAGITHLWLHIHIYKVFFRTSFIFLPWLSTRTQGVHIAPQIPQISASLCPVYVVAASRSSISYICSSTVAPQVLSEETNTKPM